MKKIIALLLSLLVLVFALCSCGSEADENTTAPDNTETAETEEIAGLANPVVEYESLDEVNNIAGTYLVHPGVMGVTEESFSVISGTLAQYKFNLNGYDYTFRGSKNLDEEISGIYGADGALFDGETADYSVKGTDEYKAIRFLAGDAQYVISVDDNGEMDDSQFDSIATELRATIITTASDEEYTSLVGSYQDSYSQRATAEISLDDVNKLKIEISWADSAEKTEEWTVLATKEGNKLVYDADSIWHNITYTENFETVDDTAAGYFEITDDGICWTGSGNEATSNCVFSSEF